VSAYSQGEKDLQRKNQLVRAIYGDKQVSSQLGSKADGAYAFGLAGPAPRDPAGLGEQLDALLICNMKRGQTQFAFRSQPAGWVSKLALLRGVCGLGKSWKTRIARSVATRRPKSARLASKNGLLR
jgi:hypothetical protein